MAVIGMACRFPGATGTEQFWELLRDGVDATSETPRGRYGTRGDGRYSYDGRSDHDSDTDAWDDLYTPIGAAGTLGSRRAGHVENIEAFDPEFFGMSAGEASVLDPQQRLLLMTAWEALEDAGLPADRLAGSRAGVYVGNTRGDHLEGQFRKGRDRISASYYENFRAMLPARLSYAFDLRGPSLLVDAACASSLIAVHTAVRSLQAGEIPLALAAGVNLVLRPDEGVMMTRAGTLAADGRSKFADASADGFAPSDGVGVVVLKPLAAALADGDRIRAVIRGGAVGNDGRTGGTLLTPSADGQEQVLTWAYGDAEVDPADVDFVEAHGSGSPPLDAVELAAIGEVLGKGRDADRPCLVGSVKTNIGHSEAAGGIAGLMKTVLVLEHRQVPASLHLRAPHPALAWDKLPVIVPTRLRDLPDPGRQLYAGVSAQGASCHNVHLVLSQGEFLSQGESGASPGIVEDTRPYPLVLSARSRSALGVLAATYVEYLEPGGRGAGFAVRDICWSAALRRQHHPYRLAVAGASHAELAAALDGGPDRAITGQADVVEACERYRRGESVNWLELFDPPGHFVPVPGHPWQTRYCGPRSPEPAAHEGAAGDLVTEVLREHARTRYEERSQLDEIGVDSLAKVRIVVELSQRFGHEVDADALTRLRTVGDLRRWLRALEGRAK